MQIETADEAWNNFISKNQFFYSVRRALKLMPALLDILSLNGMIKFSDSFGHSDGRNS